MSLFKQYDRLETVSHGHAPPIEVDDFGYRTIGIVLKIEPYLATRQIVSIESFRYLDPASIPCCFFRSKGAGSYLLPGTIVEINCFCMGNIACVNLPFFRGKIHERLQPCCNCFSRTRNGFCMLPDDMLSLTPHRPVSLNLFRVFGERSPI